MCVSVEAARQKLQSLWQSSKKSFRFAPTPVKPPSPPPPATAKRPAPPEAPSSTEQFDAILGLAPPAKGQVVGKGKADAGSGGGGGGGGFSQLRLGRLPSPEGNPAKKPKVAKPKVDRPEAATLDLLSPSVDLPTQLGRGDVHNKRMHKLERTPVRVVVGSGGVDAALAPKMRRSQNYAVPDNRPNILAECVRAYRAAAR